jgi:hypothetical protein
MRRVLPFGFIVASIFLSNSLLADAGKHALYGQFVGISHNFLKRDLSIFIDQHMIVKNIPRLQKAGLIDSNLSKAEVGFYEAELAAMISIPYASKMLQSLYSSNVQEDQIHVTSYLLTTDLYGNKAKKYCYSFNFNRQLYQKINWSNFHANNLVKIVPDFKASHDCKAIKESSPLSI